MEGKNLMFLHMWDECSEVTHYHWVFCDALFIKNNFYIADCAAETLTLEYVDLLDWMVSGIVSDKMSVSLFDQGCQMRKPLATANFITLSPSKLRVPESTMGITVHTSSNADVTVPLTNWDEYLSGWDFGNSMLQLVMMEQAMSPGGHCWGNQNG